MYLSRKLRRKMDRYLTPANVYQCICLSIFSSQVCTKTVGGGRANKKNTYWCHPD